MLKRILITGSNGLVGQKLVQKLAVRREMELLATSLGKNRITKNFNGGFGYVAMDVTNKENIKNIFSSFSPEVVIHTAAISQPDTCEAEKEKCWKTNVNAVENLMHACRQYKTKLIHLSTDFVFDGKDGMYKENDRPNPISYYGKSKLAAENIIFGNMTDWCIVRTILVYGFSESSYRPNILTRVLESAKQNQEMKIANDQFRMPTFVDDLCDAIIFIALKNKSGIFHVSGKEYLNVFDFAMKIADAWQLNKNLFQPASSESLQQSAKRPLKTGFVLLRAQTELNYNPRTIDESLLLLKKQMGNGKI